MEGGPPSFTPGFTCPALLGNRIRGGGGSAYGAVTLYRRPFHAGSASHSLCNRAEVPRPLGDAAPQPPCSNALGALTHAGVWAVARSLAATSAISVDFFSSGYLDVSVPRVVSEAAYPIRPPVPGRSPGRVPPFGDPRVGGRLRLTAAYRSLPRPSSPSCAKASAVRP